MAKQNVVFLSDMAFDANCSIIKALSDYYNIYFILSEKSCSGRVEKFQMKEDVQLASSISEFEPYGKFINLDQTYILKHYSFKDLGWKSIIQKVRIDSQIVKLIRKINPVAILNDSGSYISARLQLRKKIIQIVHDPFPHTGENDMYSRIYQKLLKITSSRYILLNENQRESFCNYYRLKPRYVFNSFLSCYEIMELFGSKDCQPDNSILFWGRISPYKGIDYLIDGFKAYIAKTGDSKTTLKIAGAGDYYFDVDNAIKDCKQIKVIKRYLSMDELADAIRACRFAICPYTDATQSGVIMTAYALGKSVVATKTGGLPEMLGHGEYGMLINPKDSNSICDAFADLLTQSQLLKEYENNIVRAYSKSGEKSWTKAIEGFCKAIESLN